MTTPATPDSLVALTQALRQFAAERDWDQFHSPKNLAMALAVEAAELMEHFQWLDEDANRTRGEFVLIVEPDAGEDEASAKEAERVLRLLLDALPLKQAVQLAVEITGGARNTLYSRALELKESTAK